MWKYRGFTVKRCTNEGFTLIEMLITIGIMAVISAGVVAMIGPGPKRTARDGSRKGDIASIVSALEIYRSDKPTYPPCNGAATSCQVSGTTGFTTIYLTNIPSDPTSGRLYAYYPLPAGCDGTTTRCIRYVLCAALEKVTALDGNCTVAGSCGTGTCSYSVTGP